MPAYGSDAIVPTTTIRLGCIYLRSSTLAAAKCASMPHPTRMVGTEVQSNRPHCICKCICEFGRKIQPSAGNRHLLGRKAFSQWLVSYVPCIIATTSTNTSHRAPVNFALSTGELRPGAPVMPRLRGAQHACTGTPTRLCASQRSAADLARFNSTSCYR